MTVHSVQVIYTTGAVDLSRRVFFFRRYKKIQRGRELVGFGDASRREREVGEGPTDTFDEDKTSGAVCRFTSACLFYVYLLP